MVAAVGRAVSKIGQTATRAAKKAVEADVSDRRGILQKGANRDPELYVSYIYYLHWDLPFEKLFRFLWESWLLLLVSQAGTSVSYGHRIQRRTCQAKWSLISIGRKPTAATSESPVSMAEKSMPWQVESSKGAKANEHFKYQYHPGGDMTKAPKDAPSALHSVVVPNVTLPKVILFGICKL